MRLLGGLYYTLEVFNDVHYCSQIIVSIIESFPTVCDCNYIFIHQIALSTVKRRFGLRAKLPPAHLSATHGEGFTRSLLMLNVQQKSSEYYFLGFWFDPTGNST